MILLFLDRSLDRTTLANHNHSRSYVLTCDFTAGFGLLGMIMHAALYARGSARHISASIDKRAQSICATERTRCTGMLECLTQPYCMHYYRPRCFRPSVCPLLLQQSLGLLKVCMHRYNHQHQPCHEYNNIKVDTVHCFDCYV